MKYFHQLDNGTDPYGSCNVSSLAMALSELGVNVTPDKLYARANQLGMHVGDPQTLVHLASEHGVTDLFTDRGTFAGMRKALDLKRNLILHGYWTGPGHIIAVDSYDANGLKVNDPYGEWFWDGYDTSVSGEGLHYSWNMIARLCSPESINNPSHIWFHQLYKK